LLLASELLKTVLPLMYVVHKTCHYYFFHSFVKRLPIVIIFSMRHQEITWRWGL